MPTLLPYAPAPLEGRIPAINVDPARPTRLVVTSTCDFGTEPRLDLEIEGLPPSPGWGAANGWVPAHTAHFDASAPPRAPNAWPTAGRGAAIVVPAGFHALRLRWSARARNGGDPQLHLGVSMEVA